MRRILAAVRPAGIVMAVLCLVLLFFVAKTDPNWFAPSEVLTFAPHHEQLGVGLVGIAGIAPWAHPQDLRILAYTVSLLLVAWFVSMVVMPP